MTKLDYALNKTDYQCEEYCLLPVGVDAWKPRFNK